MISRATATLLFMNVSSFWAANWSKAAQWSVSLKNERRRRYLAKFSHHNDVEAEGGTHR